MNKKEKFGVELFKRNHRCLTNFQRIYWVFFGKGEQFSVKEQGTNIGIKSLIKCNACGKEFDITDYDCW